MCSPIKSASPLPEPSAASPKMHSHLQLQSRLQSQPRTWLGALWLPIVTIVSLATASLTISYLISNRYQIHACPFYYLTGQYCPGCGGLRCVSNLMQGDFSLALHNNLLVVGILPFLPVLWWLWLRQRKAGRTTTIPNWAIWALTALIVAFTVLRNTLLPGLAPIPM